MIAALTFVLVGPAAVAQRPAVPRPPEPKSHDVAALVRWQERVQKQRNAQTMTLSFAFNGAAATPVPADKSALAAFLAHKQRFYWINHGYTHLWLDDAHDNWLQD